MGNLTVAILVDALRHDFITKRDSPFLSSLLNNGVGGEIKEPFAFIMHPTWFAGLYPETSGKSLVYWYSPHASPYKFTRFIPLLGDKILMLRKGLDKIVRYTSRYSYGTAPHVPLNMLKYFDFADKLPPWNPNYSPQTTLFDLLRENKLKWLFIGYPGSDQRTSAIWNKFQIEITSDMSFVWLHFAETDLAEHEYGPMSNKRKKKLKEIDETIEKIWDKLNNIFDEVNMLVFGDHGAVEVKKTVNIEGELKSLDLKVGKDYIHFLDSTIARFWFKNDIAKSKVTEMLKEFRDGKILTKQDFIRYKANFSHTKYGEFMWIANEGTLILPNFWQGNSPVKGMHGYLSDVKDNQAAFVLSSRMVDERVKLKNPCEMVDVFPTILELMNLPVPESNEGVSILERMQAQL